MPNPNVAPAKLLLVAREAAAALAISERTLFTLTHRGEVPCIRLGRSVRCSVAALEEWIAQQGSPVHREREAAA